MTSTRRPPKPWLARAPGGLGAGFAAGREFMPWQGAAYWARARALFYFSGADRAPPARFNKVLWDGLMGRRPYPAAATTRSGVEAEAD